MNEMAMNQLWATQQGKLEEKEAEIERLAEENAHFAWRDKDKNKLLCECADALSHYALLNDFEKSLIERAREASK